MSDIRLFRARKEVRLRPMCRFVALADPAAASDCQRTSRVLPWETGEILFISSTEITMTHKHREARHTERPVARPPTSDVDNKRPKFELVLKADSDGSMEALEKSISAMSLPLVDLAIIHRSLGDINKSDVLMAETGSRLIIGFQVGLLPGIDSLLREHRVEVRLYSVIYSVTADIEAIAEAMTPATQSEEIIGSAKVIALFKSTRRGIILGCRVTGGHLAVGQHFRVITAMGPVYSGRIESMHLEDRAVDKAVSDQQVGIKISDFKGAHVGDLVESYRPAKKQLQWDPRGAIIRK
jgi:translation initiation factor IF-2